MDQLARSPQQIGVAIQRARKQRGWTQAELASRAGTKQATISSIENGARAARLDLLLAILAALDLELRIAPRTRSDASDLDALF